MKVRLRTTLIILKMTIAWSLCAQTTNLSLDATQNLYEEGKFQEAIEAINEYVKRDSLNPRAYKIRGNSYYDLENMDQALADYLKSIEIDASYQDGYYNAANTYEAKQDFENAAIYFEKYISLAPDDVSGYYRLAYVKTIMGESVSDLYQKAYDLDTQNVASIYYLAMDHYGQGDYQKSMTLIERGKVMAPQEMAFVLGSGLNHLGMQAYQKAYDDFDFVTSLEPLNVNALALKVRSSLLSNTSADLWELNDNGQVRFVPANGNTLVQWVDSLDQAYNLEELTFQISQGQMLTIDQYLYYYAKQKDQPGYSPYGITLTSQISDLMKEEKYAEVADLGKNIFDKGYISLRNIDRIAQACYVEQRVSEFTLFYQLHEALLQSILSLGDGMSAEEALFVMSTSDEYAILNYLETDSQSQALIHENGHSYDKQIIETEEEEETAYYFNIDIPFYSLNRAFNKTDTETEEAEVSDEPDTKKERRKKKRKDKKDKKRKKKDSDN